MPPALPAFTIPHFSFALNGKIWKLRPDAESGNLALEVRQPETLQASFSVLNARTGTLVLRDLQTPERWWTGLEEAAGGVLLLHGYEKNRQTGKHLGLQAVKEETGQTIWQQPDLTFKCLLSETALLAENALGQLQEIELRTGAKKKYTGSAAEAQEQSQAAEQRRKAGMQLPVPYWPQDEHYPMLQEFIRQRTRQEAEQTIEYLESDKGIFVSFYAREDSVLANFLLGCSLSGEVLQLVCLERKVAGLGSDTFFIFAEKLFFIQEKSAIAGNVL